jgi:hypothetical protein
VEPLTEVRIVYQGGGQETLRRPARSSKRLSLYPTAEVSGPTDDLDHATVSPLNGMKFDVPMQGDALKVRFETDKA